MSIWLSTKHCRDPRPVGAVGSRHQRCLYSLSDPEIWRSEFGGFLSGDYFDKNRFPINGLEPYRPGQIPVVFIHGTGSSSGGWADHRYVP
jgi:pimeloyl-ACP methyl ester carboxylesterase